MPVTRRRDVARACVTETPFDGQVQGREVQAQRWGQGDFSTYACGQLDLVKARVRIACWRV